MKVSQALRKKFKTQMNVNPSCFRIGYRMRYRGTSTLPSLLKLSNLFTAHKWYRWSVAPVLTGLDNNLIVAWVIKSPRNWSQLPWLPPRNILIASPHLVWEPLGNGRPTRIILCCRRSLLTDKCYGKIWRTYCLTDHWSILLFSLT